MHPADYNSPTGLRLGADRNENFITEPKPNRNTTLLTETEPNRTETEIYGQLESMDIFQEEHRLNSFCGFYSFRLPNIALLKVAMNLCYSD